MPLCTGTKRSGGQCTATVEPPRRYCWWHDPDNAEQRSRAASKAAKSRPSRDLRSIKGQLQELADNVLAGEVERADAAVCGQLLNVKLRAVEVERKVREQEDLEERIGALEAQAQGRGGNRRWGA